MNKKAFTLIEIIISIFILFILIFAFEHVIKNLKFNKDFFYSFVKENKKTDRFFKILYADIFESNEINILNRNNNFDILLFHTNHSLYNIEKPYVIYYVSKKKNTLIRIETPFKPNLVNLELNYLVYLNIDKFESNIELFKIYKNKENMILFFKKENKKLVYFKFFT